MDTLNPTHNPPALQPTVAVKRFSQHSRSHSRSPSHSPSRPYSPLSFDPLLRSLSPSATLYAFTSPPSHLERDSRSPSPRRRDLKFSLSAVSDEQRDLGSRAAQACLDIRGWTRELASWHWPGSFEEPEVPRKKARISMMSIGSLASVTTNADVEARHCEDRYLGSLPASTVHEYDGRCREIASALDEIEMGDLKDFALHAHQHESHSIDGLLGSHDEESARNDLDDFTTLVTATVLQTLPFLSELNRLLDTWTIRLAVLKQVPTFLDELDRLRRDLDHGWAAIAVSLRKDGSESAALAEHNMHDMQSLIDARMTALGSTLDGFLDMLEGQEDTVPGIFLDKFEELELRYAEWVVNAQQRVLGDALKTYETDLFSTSISTAPHVIHTNGSFDRARTPTLRGIDRARTPVSAESDGVRSPVIYEIERAKTPVIHEFDRARTPIHDSFTAPIALVADDAGYPYSSHEQPHTQDLLRETRKSLLLRAVDHQDFGLAIDSEDDPVALSTDAMIENKTLSDKPATSHEFTSATSATPRLSSADSTSSPTQDNSTRPSADIILPAHDGRNALKIRKGNILSRLFKREQSSEVIRPDDTVSSDSHTRTGRPESGNNFVRAARRSLSRRRTVKPERAQLAQNARQPSASLERQRIGRSASPMPESTAAMCTSLHGERPRTMQQSNVRVLSEDRQHTHDHRPMTATADEYMTRPQTYQPKGLIARPMSSREQESLAENWPLGSLNTDQDHPASDMRRDIREAGASHAAVMEGFDDPDLRTVKSMAAINSDNFLDVFIGGLPATLISEQERQAATSWSSGRHDSKEKLQTSALQQDASEPLNSAALHITTLQDRNEKVRVPIVTSSMLSSDGRQDDLSVARAISFDGLKKFDQPLSYYYSDKEVNTKYLIDTRDSSLPIAVVPDHINGISPWHEDKAVADASLAETTKPLTAVHDSKDGPTISNDDDDDNVYGQSYDMTPQELPAESSQQINDPEMSPPEQDRRHYADDKGNDDSGVDAEDAETRASEASIKAHAAKELRSINTPGRASAPEKVYYSQLPSGAQSPVVESAAGSRRNSATCLNRPGYINTGTRSGAQSPVGSIDTPNFSRLRSSSVDKDGHGASSSVTVAKRRLREAPALATISPSEEHSEPPPPPPPPTTITTTKAEPTPPPKRSVPGDNFDRHVSEVLEKVPALIRFRNRAGEDISSTSPSAKSSSAKALRPRNAVISRQSSASGLTLAPADNVPRRTATTDPEIKLYHLTQAGREEPIKLYVRLVGDGERVMVRVGGGWSDLADFLRQYAEHHGSRTVSGSISGLELHTAPTSPAGSRRTSGTVPSLAERRGRPTSRDGEQAIQTPTASGPDVVQTPVSGIEAIAELPGSEPQPVKSPTNTTAAAKAAKKLSRKSSKDALSDQKARWVTRMLEKAKRETAPNRTRANKDGTFGNIGKTGSTKRVFFNSPSRATGVEEQRTTRR